MTELILLAAIIGHILCGAGDCLLSYSPSGRLDLKPILAADQVWLPNT